MKHYILLVLVIFISNKGFTQNEYYIRQWSTKPDPGLFLRPQNVSDHAYLFESNQENFKVYFWVEYLGLIDTVNKIHKMRIYERDGLTYETNYYFVIKEDAGFNVSISDYKVEDPLSNVTSLSSTGKQCKLGIFNYPATDNSYSTDIVCIAKDKDNYMLLTAYENNKFKNNISPLTPAMDVFIKVEKNENSATYTVTLQDEFGAFHKNQYALKAPAGITKPVFPFTLKYYHVDTKRIYLLNKGCYLEMIN